tara:strand:- start:40 stop:693 length:654 start_codon:yes stop_codon:yes gene_type:complete
MEISSREKFDKDGYLFVPNAISDPINLYYPPLTDKEGKRLVGTQNYIRDNKIVYEPVESQVNGSMSRYNHPSYRPAHRLILKLIENILEIDLLPTYYFDRFYYEGQELSRHTDRPSCEISATVQISTNREDAWPIWFQLPDNTEKSVSMKDGDMVIYKGYDIEHWREPLQSKYGRMNKFFNKLKKKADDTYHHQIFFHYVNAQGPYVHFAYDTKINK